MYVHLNKSSILKLLDKNMNVFFILLLCEKKLCDCRSEKKMMSLIMKEMLIVSSI